RDHVGRARTNRSRPYACRKLVYRELGSNGGVGAFAVHSDGTLTSIGAVTSSPTQERIVAVQVALRLPSAVTVDEANGGWRPTFNGVSADRLHAAFRAHYWLPGLLASGRGAATSAAVDPAGGVATPADILCRCATASGDSAWSMSAHCVVLQEPDFVTPPMR